MAKSKFVFYLLLSIVSMGLLSACNNFDTLNSAGLISKQENHLLIIAVLLMLIVVLPVLILSIIIPIRYRANRKKSAKYDPDFTHSVKLEVFWWGVPGIIIIILSIITWVSSHKLDPYRPIITKEKPINVQVVSLNWRWLFIYPEQKIATINYIAFPVNTPINLHITSDGAMNSIMIPRLGGQIYAMSGANTQLHLIADKLGKFRGRAMNFSGEGFANMIFTAQSLSKADFNKWVNGVKTKGVPLTAGKYTEIAKNNTDSKALYFSAVDPKLFMNIMKKY